MTPLQKSRGSLPKLNPSYVPLSVGERELEGFFVTLSEAKGLNAGGIPLFQRCRGIFRTPYRKVGTATSVQYAEPRP